MEALFGTDFSHVRIHVGPQAASLGAFAFTHGSNLYFAPGHYDVNSPHGQRLLAHELTHVVQQRQGRVRNPFGSGVAVVQDPGLEAEAERMALRAALALRTPPAAHPLVQRARPVAQPSRRASVVQGRLFIEIGPQMFAVARDMHNSGLVTFVRGQRALDPETELRYVFVDYLDNNRIQVRETETGTLFEYDLKGDNYQSVLEATVPQNIRASSTPQEMPDRIPPRKTFSIKVSIRGWRMLMSPVIVSVQGCSNNNGKVTVDGNASISLTATKTVKLQGISQTKPGYASKLRLVASQNGEILAQSAPFSVAAIPVDWRVTDSGPLKDGWIGLDIQDEWDSDSGNLADLDEVQISEVMQSTTKQGCFNGIGEKDSSYLIAHEPSIDSHGAKFWVFTGPGKWVVAQTHKFRDKRTGVKDVPMRNSGYEITMEATWTEVQNQLKVVTTKTGKSLTVKGVSSDAGAGTRTGQKFVKKYNKKN